MQTYTIRTIHLSEWQLVQTLTSATPHQRTPFLQRVLALMMLLVLSLPSMQAENLAESESEPEPEPTTYNLKEVQVSGRLKGLAASRIAPLKVETINQAELCKAACCNLSESFETNPSVDVSYSDALTGAKQIKLLGLSGTYVQLLSEGVPFIRGLAAPYGLSYVPGPWMESIQISKGAASVINGYEAITGQINVEYKKPATSDRLSLNLFMADNLRTEVNADAAFKVTPYLSTSTFVHYENETKEHDGNNDGFSDLPAVEQFTLFNRWYYNKDGYTSQAGLKLLTEDRQSGQIDHGGHAGAYQPYRVGIDTRRAELFTKNGYVFDPAKNTSLGLIMSASVHDQQGFYGLNQYDARQDNLYANLIFQTDFNAHHKLVAGSSLLGDRLNENLINQLATTTLGYPVPGSDLSQ
jgi:outer membrane receptor for ferrienterochelin and colicins